MEWKVIKIRVSIGFREITIGSVSAIDMIPEIEDLHNFQFNKLTCENHVGDAGALSSRFPGEFEILAYKGYLGVTYILSVINP